MSKMQTLNHKGWCLWSNDGRLWSNMDYQIPQASTSVASSSREEAAGRQHLVKWKGKSFIHCTWVQQEDIEKAIKLPLIPSASRSKLRKVLAEAEIEARMVIPCHST
jgi:hypothetical protein